MIVLCSALIGCVGLNRSAAPEPAWLVACRALGHGASTSLCRLGGCAAQYDPFAESSVPLAGCAMWRATSYPGVSWDGR